MKIPPVKPQDVVRALQRAGFVERRQRGSHLIMKRESDGRMVSIPMHQGREIPIGTLRGILRDADLTPAQFLKLLG